MRETPPRKTSSNTPGKQVGSFFFCAVHIHVLRLLNTKCLMTPVVPKSYQVACYVQLFNLQSQYNLAAIRWRLITKQIYVPRVWFAYPSPAIRESSRLWSVRTESPTPLRHPLYRRRSSCMQWICCTSHRYSGLVCPNSVPRSQQTLTWRAEESFRKQGERNLNSWYLCKLGMSREQDKQGSCGQLN